MKIRRPILTTSIAILTALAPFGTAADAPKAEVKAPEIKVDASPLPQVAGRISTFAPLVEKVSPSVVTIATSKLQKRNRNPYFNDPMFRRFFGIPEGEEEEADKTPKGGAGRKRMERAGLGSGVVVAPDGYILTNNHVIDGADEIIVTLGSSKHEYKATRVGNDPATDLAVLKIDATNLQAITFADSAKTRVGDVCIAIGNPFGFTQTVTMGIVSALGRVGIGRSMPGMDNRLPGMDNTRYEDFIQTDASINPGNSGGALVNLRGELIGINTAIYSQSGGNVGIGFAIPTNMAHQIMLQLVSHGQVKRGYLGAQFQDLNAELAEAFGLRANTGAVVVDVTANSPAARAGLVAGDVITRIKGRAITSAAELRNQIGLIRSGEKIDIGLLREGVAARASLTIASRDEDVSASGQFRNERLADTTVGEIPQDSPAAGRLQGVMVYKLERSSRAWRAGLRAGDIILSVNRQQTPSLPAFLAVVNQAQVALLLSVQRGTQSAYLVIK